MNLNPNVVPVVDELTYYCTAKFGIMIVQMPGKKEKKKKTKKKTQQQKNTKKKLLTTVQVLCDET